MTIITTLIVAMAKNRTIGKDNTLPWHIPADLKRYKERTLGKPLVMGRKTLDSLYQEVGGPLPGRTNIIITRQESFETADGVLVSSDLKSAVNMARNIAEKDGQDEIFINGGANVYGQALEAGLVDVLDICMIHQDFDGDNLTGTHGKKSGAKITKPPRDARLSASCSLKRSHQNVPRARYPIS